MYFPHGCEILFTCEKRIGRGLTDYTPKKKNTPPRCLAWLCLEIFIFSARLCVLFQLATNYLLNAALFGLALAYSLFARLVSCLKTLVLSWCHNLALSIVENAFSWLVGCWLGFLPRCRLVICKLRKHLRYFLGYWLRYVLELLCFFLLRSVRVPNEGNN